jgi:hypothetical protein
MTLRAPTGGPGLGNWRLQRRDAEVDTKFIARCLALWDEGLNTAEIADITFQWEYVVERCVRLGRERRRMER